MWSSSSFNSSFPSCATHISMCFHITFTATTRHLTFGTFWASADRQNVSLLLTFVACSLSKMADLGCVVSSPTMMALHSGCGLVGVRPPMVGINLCNQCFLILLEFLHLLVSKFSTLSNFHSFSKNVVFLCQHLFLHCLMC